MSSLLRVLIADDEPLARQHIEGLLRSYPAQVVAVTDTGPATLEAITTVQPDLVFLDIDMPGINGLEVVKQIDVHAPPVVIFVTAYDRHALEAFELEATDYLLKPFDDERFDKALKRALARCAVEHERPVGQAYLDRIAVESRGQLRSIAVEAIDYISASGVYADLHVGNQTYVLRERMQVLEQKLHPQHFIRVHRSVIVRLERIDVLLRQPGADYSVKLLNGTRLPVSRGRIEELKRWMGIRPVA